MTDTFDERLARAEQALGSDAGDTEDFAHDVMTLIVDLLHLADKKGRPVDLELVDRNYREEKTQ